MAEPHSSPAVPAEAQVSPELPARSVLRRHGRELAFFAALALAVFAAYQPAWRAGFIWDDDAHVTRPELRGLAGLGRIWTDLSATQQYYPLLHSFFWLEHRLFGDTPAPYHLVNISLHVVNVLLVGVLLRRLRVPGALIAAGIFALHPVMVESVAWITEQKNTLSGAFYLSATLAYLRFDETRRLRWHLGALGLFALALATKSVTATLPGAALVLLWWQRGRLSWRNDWLPLVPFFALGAASGLFTAWNERTIVGASGEAFAFSGVERGLIAGRALWFYAGKLIWPFDLMFIYPRWTISGAVAWQYVFPLAAVALVFALWASRRRSRGPLAAALCFGGTLFPVLGFFNVFPFIHSFVADHFQYLASLGIIALLAAGFQAAFARLGNLARVGATGVGIGMLAVLALATNAQTRIYRDAETLYRATLERNPSCPLAHTNLGALLAADRRYAEALPHHREVVRSQPRDAVARFNLGVALFETGRTSEAIREYREAVRLAPDYTAAHNNLGYALFAAGETAEAIDHYEAALRLTPAFSAAHYNLGLALTREGKISQAIAHYQTALALRPAYAEAHNNLGTLLLQNRELEAAAEHFAAAVRLKPEYAEAHNNLGVVYFQLGRHAEALAQFETALRHKPDYADAKNNREALKSPERTER